jgi:FKBP-type peptidyl-prolyl cis-trans isomerase FklB
MRQAVAVMFGVLLILCTSDAQQKIQLKTQKDSVSYSIGVNIGRNFKQQSVDVNVDILARGLKDVLSGGKTALTDEQVQATLAVYQQQMMAKQEERTKAFAEKNQKAGDAFLAANKIKEGVVTLASGLQYKVLTMGTGKKPKATDTVTVNYRGTFVDGTEFDNSFTRHEPATFAVNGVIPGWTEALQLMPVGSRWMVFIPSNLAYGERGAGQVIAPNSTLVFEVELISIK